MASSPLPLRRQGKTADGDDGEGNRFWMGLSGHTMPAYHRQDATTYKVLLHEFTTVLARCAVRGSEVFEHFTCPIGRASIRASDRIAYPARDAGSHAVARAGKRLFLWIGFS